MCQVFKHEQCFLPFPQCLLAKMTKSLTEDVITDEKPDITDSQG
jgi:hypothetical protein